MKNLELFRTFAENMEKDIIKSYVRYLKLQRNMSPNTLDAYQRDLPCSSTVIVTTTLQNCWSRLRSGNICLRC